MVYGMGVTCKTHSVLRLYNHKYSVIEVAVQPCTILRCHIDMLYSVSFPPMTSLEPISLHIEFLLVLMHISVW